MPAGKEPDSMSKIFVGGLASTTDEEGLKQFYEQWGGEITDVVVMRDGETRRSRGFGFVTFATEDQVDIVMSNRPHVINAKQVDPKRAVPREFQNKAEAQVSSKRVYVGGVKPDHTQEILREYFSKYGTIVDVDIVEDKKTGQKRGFAFITFDDNDPADKVVLLRNHTINGKRCECKKALSKDEAAKLQQNGDFQARGARSRRPPGGGYSQYNGADGYGGRGGGNNWNAPYQTPYNQAGPYGAPQQWEFPGQGGYGGFNNAAPNGFGGYGANGNGYGGDGSGFQAPAAGRPALYMGAGADAGYGTAYGAPNAQTGPQQPQGWKNASSYAGGRNY